MKEKIDFIKADRWKQIEVCPVCGCNDVIYKKKLPYKRYNFCDEIIDFPEEGINISKCSQCSLVYKNTIPLKNFLSKIFVKHEKKWNSNYNYLPEVKLINNLAQKDNFDILDIGASNGGLFNNVHTKGRCSALDIVNYSGIEKKITGEFIKGFIEDTDLNWSGNRYDIVTIFDVFEHLYDPNQAVKNLSKLTKEKGIVIIETGNIESYYPNKYGTESWWYTSLFEHHIFWSLDSLKFLAHRHKFDLVKCLYKRHKNHTYPLNEIKKNSKNMIQSSKVILHELLYIPIARIKKRNTILPRNLLAKDHLQIILQKT